jgi:hypothetical protein
MSIFTKIPRIGENCEEMNLPKSMSSERRRNSPRTERHARHPPVRFFSAGFPSKSRDPSVVYSPCTCGGNSQRNWHPGVKISEQAKGIVENHGEAEKSETRPRRVGGGAGAPCAHRRKPWRELGSIRLSTCRCCKWVKINNSWLQMIR